MNAASLIYVAVFAASGLVCLAAIPRARAFDLPDVRRGLVWLLATTGAWSLSTVAFFLVPDPLREPTYLVGLVLGFATVWPWLYFCSAYTNRRYHRRPALRRLGLVVFVTVSLVKVTNPLHGLYFSATEATTPFAYLAIEHGVLHWSVTGLAYVLSALGLFVLLEQYALSGYDTGPLSALTALLGLPVLLDVGALTTPWLINVLYAPLGVAAFAIGVLFAFDGRFLAARRDDHDDDAVVFLDAEGTIRDHSPAAEATFPELADARGDRLATVLPAVAAVVDGDERILARDDGHDREDADGDGTRYYSVTTSAVAFDDSTARIVSFVDVTRDERQRRALADSERELDERTEIYRAVVDTTFDSVFRADLDGRFTYCSPSVEAFLGYAPAELEGRPLSVTHPDADTTDWAMEKLSVVLEGETTQARDFPLKTKAGRTVYADVRGAPIYDGSVPDAARTPDDIVGVLLMARDATERRQREQLIGVINRVLRHNLRNDMTVISGYAGLLADELEGDAEKRAALIGETANRLIDLSESAQRIEENRDLSVELESVDFVPIVDRLVDQLRTRYPEVSVTVDAPEEAVARTLPRVETALWELLDNAAKHGGTPPAVDVEVTVTDADVAVAVTDDGPGIPADERSVLESGEETPLVHGQGLGLWLVFWIVTTLDGDVDATTSSGTTVTVRLPARE
ncbi:PAS domain S-box protein [Halorubrum sp. JWXQ-INN 858]|uniref:PAS domain S-box protein n=1 Tax=Halorubrum sp. JWXQ-INN 858 TaxID=2690782 RepID=UPI0013FBBAA8|nr:PAS domain S-box protein [Halorubrum sp. JWXQ-INN 858]MWV65849.1 PAS domain S-box protein [Halorubrum sp. JWXQ-INN 858]